MNLIPYDAIADKQLPILRDITGHIYDIIVFFIFYSKLVNRLHKCIASLWYNVQCVVGT